MNNVFNGMAVSELVIKCPQCNGTVHFPDHYHTGDCHTCRGFGYVNARISPLTEQQIANKQYRM